MRDQRSVDVLIVGAGPAGMSAAIEARRYGAKVLVVDEGRGVGGQIWRGQANSTTRQFLESGSEFQLGSSVVDVLSTSTLLVESAGRPIELSAETVVLCNGARELFLPFPGWTLPGVVGAGGAQALIKNGFDVTDKRVVVSGSGPLLIAVAAALANAGALVESIYEQATSVRMAKFMASMAANPAKLAQGIEYKADLFGVSYQTGCWVTEAKGSGHIKRVTVTNGKKIWDEPCDLLACGYGLVANTELASLMGCSLRRDEPFNVVSVDELMRTSVAGVLCAGEPTGIGGVDKSVIEGRIAGLVAVMQHHEAEKLLMEAKKQRRFAHMLAETFVLRDDLRSVPSSNTVFCRCEDVTIGEVMDADSKGSRRASKLTTRCGMGPCQGRICGAAGAFLFGWGPDTVRPPLQPTRIASIIEANL